MESPLPGENRRVEKSSSCHNSDSRDVVDGCVSYGSKWWSRRVCFIIHCSALAQGDCTFLKWRKLKELRDFPGNQMYLVRGSWSCGAGSDRPMPRVLAGVLQLSEDEAANKISCNP